MNTILVWIGNLIVIPLYYSLVSGILCGEIKQSFATWILWISLDTIALGSIILQHGNYWILVFYITGGTAVTLSLIYTKQFKWARFETFVLFLVTVCLVVWALSGSRWATISSTLAVCISGIPQLVESWRKPDKKIGWIYVAFLFANGFSFFGGKTWTVEERFYPGACAVLCITIAGAAFRKNLPVKQSEPKGNI